MTMPTEDEIPADAPIAEVLAALANRFDGQSAAMTALADQVESLDRSNRTLRWVAALQAVMIATLVVLAVLNYLNIGPTRDAAESSRASVEIMRECTTPGDPHAAKRSDRTHECYDKGQSATAAAITQINAGTLAAFVAVIQCVADRDPDLRACAIGKTRP